MKRKSEENEDSRALVNVAKEISHIEKEKIQVLVLATKTLGNTTHIARNLGIQQKYAIGYMVILLLSSLKLLLIILVMLIMLQEGMTLMMTRE